MCQSDKKRMRWWNDHVEAGVRKKKRVFKGRIEVQASEAPETS